MLAYGVQARTNTYQDKTKVNKNGATLLITD